MEKQNLREVIQIVVRDENSVDRFILAYKDTLEIVSEASNEDIWEDINNMY